MGTYIATVGLPGCPYGQKVVLDDDDPNVQAMQEGGFLIRLDKPEPKFVKPAFVEQKQSKTPEKPAIVRKRQPKPAQEKVKKESSDGVRMQQDS